MKQEEKLTVRCGRDGGVEALEVLGMIMLRVKSEEYGRVIVAVNNKDSRNLQLQVNEEKSMSFAGLFNMFIFRHIQILIRNCS